MPGFDRVDELQVGAGVDGGGEGVAQVGERSGATWGGCGVEVDVQFAFGDMEVAGQFGRFTEKGAGFVAGPRGRSGVRARADSAL